jgi:large subunit ribosomal protein L15
VKLHDLKPAPGSRKAKRRVGRGIAAGQGKTAGRGTKGQKARAGGKIPAWFEGGQTPLHQRIPKLRGFRNPFKIQYEIVNLGDIARLVEAGELESGDMPGTKASKKGAAPITVNQEILRAAGLVRRLDRPMKVLGAGDLDVALFVVADAFSTSARTKIEGAGGAVSVLEVPDAKRAALGLEPEDEATAEAGAGAGEPADEDQPEPATAQAESVDSAPTAAAATALADEEVAEAGPKRQARGKAAPATDGAESDDTAEAVGDAAAAGAPDAGVANATEESSAEGAAPDEPAARPRAARKPKAPKPDTDA